MARFVSELSCPQSACQCAYPEYFLPAVCKPSSIHSFPHITKPSTSFTHTGAQDDATVNFSSEPLSLFHRSHPAPMATMHRTKFHVSVACRQVVARLPPGVTRTTRASPVSRFRVRPPRRAGHSPCLGATAQRVGSKPKPSTFKPPR